MAKENQSQKPISDTRAFLVIGDSPQVRFENVLAGPISAPKGKAAANPEHREDFERLLKGMAKSSE